MTIARHCSLEIEKGYFCMKRYQKSTNCKEGLSGNIANNKISGKSVSFQHI